MLLERLEDIAQNLIKALQNEFEDQGHNNTGAGMQSLRAEVSVEGDVFRITILGFDYLQYVNFGRYPGKMPPVQVILEWVNSRGIASGKEAESMAWAIAKAIEREGIPTEGAYAYSNNGRRKGFIEIVKQEQEKAALQQARRAVIDMYREQLLKGVTNGVGDSVAA